MKDIEPPSLTTLWDLEGRSQVQQESIIGIPYPELGKLLEAAGFIRFGSAFTKGPCVECRETVPTKHLDRDRRCPGCYVPKPAGPVIVAGTDLTKERALRDEREEERAMGIRDELPTPNRTPIQHRMLTGKGRPR